MTTRAMVEDLGIRVVDVDGLCDVAAYVEDVHVLLVRPGVSDATMERCASLILLSDEATA